VNLSPELAIALISTLVGLWQVHVAKRQQFPNEPSKKIGSFIKILIKTAGFQKKSHFKGVIVIGQPA
jgi:hypothetical protein